MSVDLRASAEALAVSSEEFYARYGRGELKGGECCALRAGDREPHSYLFACPGCRRPGLVSLRPDGWRVVGGSSTDPSGVSLEPSILHDDPARGGACGWHGYLTNGEFKPC